MLQGIIVGGATVFVVGLGVLTACVVKVGSDADDRLETMRDQEWIAAAKRRAAIARAEQAHPSRSCSRSNVIPFPARRPYDWSVDGGVR